MHRILAISLAVLAFTGWSLSAQAGGHLSSEKTIVTNAAQADNLTTLVAAVKAAGLVDALNGDGPLTVFAPTDEAFAKLPKGTVESLLKPENKDKLVSILTYHVVPGRVYASDVVKLKSAKTAQGSEININVASGVKVNDVPAGAFDSDVRPGDEIKVGRHRFLRIAAADGA